MPDDLFCRSDYSIVCRICQLFFENFFEELFPSHARYILYHLPKTPYFLWIIFCNFLPHSPKFHHFWSQKFTSASFFYSFFLIFFVFFYGIFYYFSGIFLHFTSAYFGEGFAKFLSIVAHKFRTNFSNLDSFLRYFFDIFFDIFFTFILVEFLA